MAEAVVGERAQVPTRFYCHMCNVEINILSTDYTCPFCSGGFIEELPTPPSIPLTPPAVAASTSNIDAGDAGSRPPAETGQRMNDLEIIRGEIATLLMSRNIGPAGVEISIDPGNRRGTGNLLSLGNGSGSSSVGSGNGGGPRTRRRHQNFDRLDNVLLDFFHSISGDVDGPFGNSQMFFMGNPGDYAWGREGIDTIVTQLLNQMETSGPPPLAKEKIQEIPKVEITEEEIDNKLQCSVCWEDFRLKEIVRKLPCMHIYHENCIVPWLDLHGTCPICRKSLAIDTHTDDAAIATTTCPFHSSNSASTSGSQASSTTAAGTLLNNPSTSAESTATVPPPQPQTTSNTSQSNNVFAFDDGNVDYDFD